MNSRIFRWFLVCIGALCVGIHCGPERGPRDELVILPAQESADEETPISDLPAEIMQREPAQEPTTALEGTPEPGMTMDASEPSGPEPREEPASRPEPPSIPDTATEPVPERSTPPEPRPALKNWIGEACTTDRDCDVPGGICLKASAGYPGGHCSAPCTGHCPDRTGKPVTFCIADATGQGMCVRRCSQVSCRAGYVCESRSRFQQATVQEQICIPPRPTPPGGSRTFLYLGDSQSSGSKFGGIMVGFLRDPQASCPAAKTGNNKVYSYAKVSAASRHWSEASGSSKDWLCGATTVYVNGTAPANTNGAALCAGITNVSKSIFQKLIDTHKPNAFVIQLGGNSAGFSQSYVKAKITAMLDHMPSGSLCFWVTPSASSSQHIAKRRDIETWTREVLQGYTRLPCQLLTSMDEMLQQTSCSAFNVSDGIHMTSCGSTIWGQLITKKMCQGGKM